MAKKWIAKAIAHPGALHKELGVPAGKKIPAKRLAAAAQKGGTLGKRARLAQTLKKFRNDYPHGDTIHFTESEKSRRIKHYGMGD